MHGLRLFLQIPGISPLTVADEQLFRQRFPPGVYAIPIAEYIAKLLPHRPTYMVQTLLYDPTSQQKLLDVVIRPVRETDFNNLALLYRDLYNSLSDLGESWTKESAHRFVSHFYHRQPDLFFLAEHKGQTVGAIVAAVQPWWDGNHLVEGELFTIRATATLP